MKKIYTLLFAAMSLSTLTHAQNEDHVNITGPTFIEEFSNNNYTATGVSADGRYVFGVSQNGSAAVYDFEGSKEFSIIYNEEESTFPVSIVGSTPDGRILVSTYSKSYLLNLEDGSKEYLEFPEPDYGLDAWDITADGKMIVCNLTNEGFETFPMIGVLQDDGKYKFTELDYSSDDALGCQTMNTIARFISDDGKFVMGIQPSYNGMSGRPIVWTRQDDGTYKYSFPMDDYIFDTSYDKPGKIPDWYEYVTANQVTEPELFNKQNEEYLKAYDEYLKNNSNYTRNGSSFDMYTMTKSTRSNILCCGYFDYAKDVVKEGEIPVFYNCDENKITEYTDLEFSSTGIPMSLGVNELPGDGHVVATQHNTFYSLTAIDKDGNKKPFEQWLKDLTGTDISEHYTFSYYNQSKNSNDKGVFLGKPYFSENGKVLLLSGVNSSQIPIASVIRFDRDIFEATNTGIEENMMDNVDINGGMINIGTGKQAVADVYTIDGALCGSYRINGTLNFNTVLSRGSYVIKVNIEGEKSITKKILVD